MSPTSLIHPADQAQGLRARFARPSLRYVGLVANPRKVTEGSRRRLPASPAGHLEAFCGREVPPGDTSRPQKGQAPPLTR